MALFILGILVLPGQAANWDDVEKSLDRAKAYLYSTQKNGNWETSQQRLPASPPYDTAGGQWGGHTAISTYALLAAGESPSDPRILEAVKFLRKADMVGIYAIGVRAQVWPFLPMTAENKACIKRDYQLLVKGITKSGPWIGTFDYLTSGATRTDLSASQYGVLGFWACEQSGAVEVPMGLWKQVEKSWIDYQQSNGGWCYEGNPRAGAEVDIAMTAAGVATLFITQDYNRAEEGLACKGNIRNEHIERGLKYIGEHFNDAIADPPRATQYALYGIERIGVASGYKYINDIDWYQKGADYLLKRQTPEGAWDGIWRTRTSETPLGMLFLARGRAPVIINKLEYGGAPSPPADSSGG